MPDLSAALREAIIGHAAISGQLSQWAGEPAVFTRVPIPDDAAYPLCVIPAATAIGDFDGLNSSRPMVMRDIIFYGRKGAPGVDDYRIVEQMAFEARRLFHRQKFSAVPSGFAVVDIRVNGPMPAPVDDEKTVARMISLIIRLREN
jgi:hypothetical protein